MAKEYFNQISSSCETVHCILSSILCPSIFRQIAAILRGSPCKNRPLEFLKITDFLQTFCVEEVIHKMNKKR
jgi:hypothetical protein